MNLLIRSAKIIDSTSPYNRSVRDVSIVDGTIAAVSARRILQLDIATIKEGSKAEITIFDPEKKWTFSEHNIHSKLHNTPVVGTELLGSPVGIYNNNKLINIKAL